MNHRAAVQRSLELDLPAGLDTLRRMTESNGPHILVLGAGFGGLTFCQKFRHPTARVTLVDRENHHLFQPLLYQVATAGLAPAEIAQPVRSIFSDHPRVTVLMDTATGIDLSNRRVAFEKNGELDYDYLVLALGGVTSYFGHPEWEEHAPGLKSIDDAIQIRHDVLLAFERAENEKDPKVHERLMTLIVVGGGPTGVELAGAFAELTRNVLRRDFRHIDPTQARVVLLEAGPRLLPQFPEDLSESARRQLAELGVDVRLDSMVKDLGAGRVELNNGDVLEAENIIWAAGVGSNPLARELGVDTDRAGRVKVNGDLSLPGHPEVFAVGDMATLTDAAGRVVPGMAPAAMQMGRHVARLLEEELAHPPAARPARTPFKYTDKGTMATIGRSRAVAMSGPFRMTGFLAWLAWLVIHLLFLVGLRNKLAVLLQWAYSYFAYKRGARIITRPPQRSESS